MKGGEMKGAIKDDEPPIMRWIDETKAVRQNLLSFPPLVLLRPFFQYPRLFLGFSRHPHPLPSPFNLPFSASYIFPLLSKGFVPVKES
jgi:hypothetical protein